MTETVQEAKNQTLEMNKAGVEAARIDYEAFLEETKHPYEVNEQLLFEILRDNKDCEYGRKYDFAGIESYEDFKAKVPVIEYEDIDEYVERMATGEKGVLTSYPFNHMNATSGTVGKQKRIPMTDKLQGIFLKYNKHYNDAFYAEVFGDSWMGGRFFCTSQGSSEELPSGITVGDASSVMAKYVQGGLEGLNAMMQVFFTSPVEASIPTSDTDARYLHARFALEDKHITAILSGYYSLIVQYLHYISENYELLINDIENGTIDASVQMPDDVRASVEARLVPNPERAAELREIFKNGSKFQFVPMIWPDLVFMCAVGGAGFSMYSNTVKQRYAGDSVKYVFSGITASEALFSVPVAVEDEDGCMAPGSAFFEFLPVEAGDDFSQVVTIDKVEEGKVYELIVTTVSGFYRYRMRDCVKVVSFFNETPRVRYMYRSNNVLDLACEKTTEQAMTLAVEKTADDLGFPLSDFTVYGDRRMSPPGYVFLIQPEMEVEDITTDDLQVAMENNIRAFNAEYDVVRNCSELSECRCEWLQPQTTFLYRDIQVSKGASVNQLKPLRIIKNAQQKRFFFGFIDKGGMFR